MKNDRTNRTRVSDASGVASTALHCTALHCTAHATCASTSRTFPRSAIGPDPASVTLAMTVGRSR